MCPSRTKSSQITFGTAQPAATSRRVAMPASGHPLCTALKCRATGTHPVKCGGLCSRACIRLRTAAATCRRGSRAYHGVQEARPPDRWFLAAPLVPQGLASSTKLKGVSAARRNRLKPPWVTTSFRRCSPACAPRQAPTSWERDAGVHMNVDAE